MNTRKNRRFFVSQKPKVSVKPVRVILLDEADEEYKRLNEVVGQQIKDGKENTEEMQLLKSIKQKGTLSKLILFMEIILRKERFLSVTMFRTCGELS